MWAMLKEAREAVPEITGFCFDGNEASFSFCLSCKKKNRISVVSFLSHSSSVIYIS